MDRVEDVRFIQLSLKDIITNNLYTYSYYLELPFSYINYYDKSDCYSIQFKLPPPLALIALCKNVMDKFMLSPINSIDGISIVTL